MKCRKCGNAMRLLGVSDTGTSPLADGKSYAYNVYSCDECMIVARENVWNAKAVVWVLPDNSVETTLPEGGDAQGDDGPANARSHDADRASPTPDRGR